MGHLLADPRGFDQPPRTDSPDRSGGSASGPAELPVTSTVTSARANCRSPALVIRRRARETLRVIRTRADRLPRPSMTAPSVRRPQACCHRHPRVVPEPRFELGRPCGRRILSPLRLPVPPLRPTDSVPGHCGVAQRGSGVLIAAGWLDGAAAAGPRRGGRTAAAAARAFRGPAVATVTPVIRPPRRSNGLQMGRHGPCRDPAHRRRWR